MPELPEVETVKEGLNKIIEPPQVIRQVTFWRKNLRTDLPLKESKNLSGQEIKKIYRRAKYIIIETNDYSIISHLGMTGSWRVSHEAPGTHDHVGLELSNGTRLVYRDPRRFGIFDILPKDQLNQDQRFRLLGPEPLSNDFNEAYLFSRSRHKKVPVKNFIMDQRVVVGVGNIYASEALFMAQISPLVQAQKVSQAKYKLLVRSIEKVLTKAIKSGGSTIRNFAAADGESGYFQQSLKVYGRDGEPCRKCGTRIKNKILAGRSTFWCVKCQK